jgi:deoxyribonuclease-4
MENLAIGCHVSIAEGVWNAPKNAADLKCETFQIFTRSPQGGSAPELTPEAVDHFKEELKKYYFNEFVVHSPYYVNFGSSENRIYHGSISVIKQEMTRANLLGAKYVMTHLGSFKNALEKDVLEYAGAGLVKILEEYEGQTKLLLEIAAGGGNIVGDTFEELVVVMEPLAKFKTFGGICFDTQHAFASGYDLRNGDAVRSTFEKFDKVIGLKWLKMSHINDSKPEFGSHRDRHEHLGEGKIGKDGIKAILEYFSDLSTRRSGGSRLSTKGETKKVAFGAMPLILETNHDKVETDIKILKALRDGLGK